MSCAPPPAARGRRFDLLGLAAAAAACLLPFAGKPIHIDDPFFVWSAQNIHEHPLDPYGFPVNWDHYEEPMWRMMQNPPLAAYYAAAAGLFGWHEVILHVAFWLPAVGVLWGTYRLAERLGAPPLLAALGTLVAPVFFVSATTLMCDVPMLCGWVWALVWWDRGLRERSIRAMYVAGSLALVAVLTKYFAICLVPLMTAYALAVDPRAWRRWGPPLGLAVMGVVGYQAASQALYGRDLIGKAASFNTTYIEGLNAGVITSRTLSTLGFVGAGVGGAVLLLPRPLAWRWLIGSALVAAAGTMATRGGETTWWYRAQLLAWAATGGGLVLAAVARAARRRDPIDVLLALWVGGTVLFTAVVNHSVNARSVLPALPALAIVVLRLPGRARGLCGGSMAALVPAVVLAAAVAWADMRMAEAGRAAAERAVTYAAPGHTLWFHGHCGWQYYLMQAGGRPWDRTASRAEPGDVVALAYNFYCLPRPTDDRVRTLTEFDIQTCPWLATMQPAVGGGFYSFYWGLLPYAFGPVPPERFEVVEVVRPYGPPNDTPSGDTP